jgi:hypothetical protein
MGLLVIEAKISFRAIFLDIDDVKKDGQCCIKDQSWPTGLSEQ